jgi:RNA polymerase sigma factor (sigma-70 family)
MPELSDNELLQDYSRNGSETAFAELVRRHIDLVYSAALRQVGIAAQAEEITQVVFIILARKAGRLHANTVLEGWLYETTRLTSLSFLRGERRRQFREQEAYMQSTLQETADDAFWNQLSPLLDEALSHLGRKDRDAVMLRFFKDKSVREIAAAMNVSEAAAQRRVLRAMERLREFFAKHGLASTTEILAEKISSHSVKAAPVMLAETVTVMAIAKGAAASASTLTLIQGALKLMAWTKTKIAVVAGVTALLAVGATSVLINACLPTPEFQGLWEGTIPLPGVGVHAGESPKTRLVLTIVKTNGAYQAVGDNIDQGLHGVTIDLLTYKYPRVHAEIPNMHESYNAKINRAGTTLTGIWSQNTDSGPLTFSRITTPPPFPEPLTDDEFARRASSDLQGFWKGAIGTGKNTLQVNIKIAESPDGTFRADFFVPPQGGYRQPTFVSYDGTTVKLMPLAGYGMFQGELRNGGKELAGNWIQGGQKTPTTFALAN